MMSVLSVEARVVYEVDAAADNVARGEGGPVGLPRAGRAERVSIVAMVTVRVFVPACNCLEEDVEKMMSAKMYRRKKILQV